jgi:heat shock protein HslJ
MTKTALLFALPLLTACATVPAAAPELTGTSWRFTAIDGAAPISDRAELEFLADRISASVGCNGMGGEWHAKDGKLITGPFVSTLMYCDGLMEQERAVSQTISAQPSYTLQGDRLVLTGGGHRLELRRAD